MPIVSTPPGDKDPSRVHRESHRILEAIIVAALFGVPASQTARADSADCASTHLRFADGESQQRSMWVNKDTACEFGFHINNSERGTRGIYSSAIIARPRNGI